MLRGDVGRDREWQDHSWQAWRHWEPPATCLLGDDHTTTKVGHLGRLGIGRRLVGRLGHHPQLVRMEGSRRQPMLLTMWRIGGKPMGKWTSPWR